MKRGAREWVVWSRRADGSWREVWRGDRARAEESVLWYREQGSDVVALPDGRKP